MSLKSAKYTLAVLVLSSEVSLASQQVWHCDFARGSFYDSLYRPIENPGMESFRLNYSDPLPLTRDSWRRGKTFGAAAWFELKGELQDKYGDELRFEAFEMRVNRDENSRSSFRRNHMSYFGEGTLDLGVGPDDILSDWAPMLFLKRFQHPEDPVEINIQSQLSEYKDLYLNISIPASSCQKI